MPGGMERPVALHGAQLARRVADRGDGQALHVEPGVGRPGRRPRGAARHDQPVEHLLDIRALELGEELGQEAFRGEVGGARLVHAAAYPATGPSSSARAAGQRAASRATRIGSFQRRGE